MKDYVIKGGWYISTSIYSSTIDRVIFCLDFIRCLHYNTTFGVVRGSV